jgi:NTP pyrophosphatase (non-canonical NTP hydrolase)
MELSEMQSRAKRNSERKGYTTDLLTLALGVCEESGELAKAVNMENPLYKAKDGVVFDSIEHELGDLLVYISCLANSAGIDLNSLMEEKLIYKGE